MEDTEQTDAEKKSIGLCNTLAHAHILDNIH